MSERIKNEIIPLLSGSQNDDDLEELDDEVAMISNKKSQDDDAITAEDIKIEIKYDESQRTAKSANVNDLQRRA